MSHSLTVFCVVFRWDIAITLLINYTFVFRLPNNAQHFMGYVVFWESLPQFAEHVVPLLRERGVVRREYSGTTLRENFRQQSG